MPGAAEALHHVPGPLHRCLVVVRRDAGLRERDARRVVAQVPLLVDRRLAGEALGRVELELRDREAPVAWADLEPHALEEERLAFAPDLLGQQAAQRAQALLVDDHARLDDERDARPRPCRRRAPRLTVGHSPSSGGAPGAHGAEPGRASAATRRERGAGAALARLGAAGFLAASRALRVFAVLGSPDGARRPSGAPSQRRCLQACPALRGRNAATPARARISPGGGASRRREGEGRGAGDRSERRSPSGSS